MKDITIIYNLFGCLHPPHLQACTCLGSFYHTFITPSALLAETLAFEYILKHVYEGHRGRWRVFVFASDIT